MTQKHREQWTKLYSDELRTFPFLSAPIREKDTVSPILGSRKELRAAHEINHWQLRFDERKRCAAIICPHCARGVELDSKFRHTLLNKTERCQAHQLWATLPHKPEDPREMYERAVLARRTVDYRQLYEQQWETMTRDDLVTGRLKGRPTARFSDHEIAAISADVCPVCAGQGEVTGETCWHCDGEGIDPAFEAPK